MLLITYHLSFITPAHADAVIDNGINYLKQKQVPSGQIDGGGFSDASPWSAIAFEIRDIHIEDVKNSSVSLKDFFVNNVPGDAYTLATRILVIVAAGDDPTNFGGNNYVQKLESFHHDSQIDNICILNDDLFGLLALISAGNSSDQNIKQDTLNFIIDHQAIDGGFSYSAPSTTCPDWGTDPDTTSAAIQVLQAAKTNGLTNPKLDDSISMAKEYLLDDQDAGGGFLAFGSPSSDTTGWALMALNVLGMQDSEQAAKARTWLASQQSQPEGGFLSYGTLNSTTTAHALIALSGSGWFYRPSIPVPTISVVSPTPTPTPTTSSSSSNSSTPTPTPTNTTTPTLQVKNKTTSDLVSDSSFEDPQPTPAPEVLGQSTQEVKPDIDKKQLLIKNLTSGFLPLLFGFGLYVVVRFWERRWRKNV